MSDYSSSNGEVCGERSLLSDLQLGVEAYPRHQVQVYRVPL